MERLPNRTQSRFALVAVLGLAGLVVGCDRAQSSGGSEETSPAGGAVADYVRTAKTSEAQSNLRALHTGGIAYLIQERMQEGTFATNCSVGPAITSNAPGSERTPLGALPRPFTELGFAPVGGAYFRYEIVAAPPTCGHGANAAIYTFRAQGDLDDDGVLSTFELVLNTDANGDPVDRGELHIVDELE